ncbi:MULTISPECIES: esterase-like activity of phytase family protein [unclassified Corynebacterium]|uniref:esterase-like activity of phytase family protein n=1 Tax=unclassified Corynebacterium TaxID=2624378 RepID=UPI0029C9DBB5|nr:MULTISPECIES: esterase-like activity of phytase family protein [unclassified Corynebacterium]WPF66005.1 esterase-like activity of phytase family protein [Corynebacterium sp. 22KM0430]WPF68498.1 esterase-like activity of phytase family protein [Corynebacterium sp. 21KM1197]
MLPHRVRSLSALLATASLTTVATTVSATAAIATANTATTTNTAPPFPSEYLGTTDLSRIAATPGTNEQEANKQGVDKRGEAPSFGGISGLERLPGTPENTANNTAEYLALSDDSAEHGPSRAYHLAIPTEPHSSDSTEPALADTITLRDTAGQPYAPRAVDPESVRLLPSGNLAWTSEGWAKDGDFRPPAVIISDASGRELSRLKVPAYHAPNPEGTAGIRHNKANEGLALVSEDVVMTANEGALVQDGPMNTAEQGMRVRLTQYSVSTGEPLAEYALEVGALYPGARDRGISEIIAGDDGSFYVIERGYVAGEGNRGEIYRVTLDGATNVLGQEQLTGAEIPVRKELVFDFSALPEHPDNIEALAWAPRLSDGRAQLLVLSDDNFSDKQRTLLHRIALGTPQQEAVRHNTDQ